jgi:hypothetical protein
LSPNRLEQHLSLKQQSKYKDKKQNISFLKIYFLFLFAFQGVGDAEEQAAAAAHRRSTKSKQND